MTEKERELLKQLNYAYDWLTMVPEIVQRTKEFQKSIQPIRDAISKAEKKECPGCINCAIRVPNGADGPPIVVKADEGCDGSGFL